MSQILEPVTPPEELVTSGGWEEIGMGHFTEPGGLKKMAAVKRLSSERGT